MHATTVYPQVTHITPYLLRESLSALRHYYNTLCAYHFALDRLQFEADNLYTSSHWY